MTRSKRFLSRIKPALLALAGGLIVAAGGFGGTFANYLLSVDRGFGDNYLYKAGDPPPRDDLVFLGIDEGALTLEGLSAELIGSDENLAMMANRFPWDRRVYANAMRKLIEAGAKVVVLDLVLAEESDPDADAALAELISDYPEKIVLASALAPISSELDGFTLIEPSLRFLQSDPPPAHGFVNFRPNPRDGIVRGAWYRTTLSQENDQPAIPGEPVYDSLAGAVIKRMGKKIPSDYGNIRFATAGDKDMGTRLYPPLSIRSIFIRDDWEHRYFSGAFFKDKIVMIGPAAARFQDHHQTPVGQLMGPQLHLQAIAAGLNGDFVDRPFGEWRAGVVWFALLGAICAAILVYLVPRPIIALMIGIGFICAAFASSLLLAHYGHTWVGLLPFGFAFFLGAVFGQTYDLLRERFERSRLHSQFRRFVSRDVADSLVLDPGIYQKAAAGRKRRVVVLFSDIRGFTSLSEKLQPEQLFAQLNEYLTAMVAVIFEHNGTLDKFIGDAIMAHWGALGDGDESEFARSAVAATEAMTVALEELNEIWKERGLPELAMGVGLHLGEVLAGEIGSEQRTEFGVIGDAVNLSSRLEGLTKGFGCPWLASGAIIAATGPLPRTRRVAKVRVKGRKKPVELLGSLPLRAISRILCGSVGELRGGRFRNGPLPAPETSASIHGRSDRDQPVQTYRQTTGESPGNLGRDHRIHGEITENTADRTRTGTPVRATDFKSAVSTIPPRRRFSKWSGATQSGLGACVQKSPSHDEVNQQERVNNLARGVESLVRPVADPLLTAHEIDDPVQDEFYEGKERRAGDQPDDSRLDQGMRGERVDPQKRRSGRASEKFRGVEMPVLSIGQELPLQRIVSEHVADDHSHRQNDDAFDASFRDESCRKFRSHSFDPSGGFDQNYQNFPRISMLSLSASFSFICRIRLHITVMIPESRLPPASGYAVTNSSISDLLALQI